MSGVVDWFGYMGKILEVDLTSSRVRVRDLKEEDADMFIGGIGLATKLIFDEMDPRVEPFSPDNVLIFMTGPLTGTMVQCSGRYVVAAKSPLTMAWGEAHASGFWGVELKRAGFDGIIIKGRSSNPVYLYVHDGEVEIRDASRYWGLTTVETDLRIKEELGDKAVRVAAIGPAGERLVRYAIIASDITPDGPRVAGRTGMGAVMGSKNLKAIAVKGSGQIKVKDPERLRSNINRLLPYILSYPTTQIYSIYGTAGEVEEFYEYGDMPIKNFTVGKWDNVYNISGRAFREKGLVKAHRACWACPIHCWKYVEVNNVKGRGPEYETIASLGSMLMIDDPEYLIKANDLCNKYGIDTISTGVTIAWAMESFEKGLLTKDDTGGLELKWGDKETVLKLIEMIGRREGFGKLLGEGCRMASRAIGRGTEKYCMHVKGTEMPMHDPRAFKGMGLQYATSNRGADHLQGLTFRIEQGERITDLKIYERYDRVSYMGKGRIVATMETWHEVLESLVICKFISIPPLHLAGMYTLVTGRRKTLQDLLTAGRRIFTLKRMFNVINGISRRDDTLPERFLKEPLSEGGAKGQVVELEPMLDEYYSYMGWDKDGIPTIETLKELGILPIVEKYMNNK